MRTYEILRIENTSNIHSNAVRISLSLSPPPLVLSVHRNSGVKQNLELQKRAICATTRVKRTVTSRHADRVIGVNLRVIYVRSLIRPLSRAFLSRTGLITVGNDISQLFVSVVLSYYAGKGHRPRWIAFGIYTVSFARYENVSPDIDACTIRNQCDGACTRPAITLAPYFSIASARNGISCRHTPRGTSRETSYLTGS